MRKITIGILGIALFLGLGIRRADAGPLDQILSALTDGDSGLAAIKRQIAAIEAKLLITRGPLRRSSGLFSLPAAARSVDWTVINEATTAQTVTVTVFQVGVGLKTVAAPGPLTVTVAPGESTHNANSVAAEGPFIPGFNYEIIIEGGSPNVLPMCEVWQDLGNTVIAGTAIPAGSWVTLQ
ncbi:MAG TPA: hypothetical protein VIX73_38275 [Kofleriaceae bacterium]|jgi:hypothetical protein